MTTVRGICEAGRLVAVPNVWDGLSALAARRAGAAMLATSSAAVAWSMGYADGERLPIDRVTGLVSRIARLGLPVSVDIEEGYCGSADGMERLVRQLLDVGMTGCNIEDGSEQPEVLCGKIERLKRVAAACGNDLFVNARTDVYLRGLAADQAAVGMTLQRAELYATAGADGIFVPGMCASDDIAAVVRDVSLPLNLMHMEGLTSLAELEQLGVRRLSAGPGLAFAVSDAFTRAARCLMETADANVDGVPGYAAIQAVWSD